MASIKKSPELPDYFIEMDWNDRKSDPIGFSEALVGHYEDGEIVILRNSPIVADYALLNHVSLPKGLAYKKIRDDYFTRPRLNLESLRLHRYLVQHYPTKYRAICREVTRTSNVMREVGQQLFPHYRFTKMPCSWRFTPTGPEHMHIDSFGALGDEEEKWYLRIFFNVDEQPRLWNLSYTLTGLAERYYQDAGMEKWCQGRGSDFSRELSRWIYDVLIFERIREEISAGNSPQASIHSGYEKALSSIADANITTLIAAVVLFAFGTGPIKGFAITLSLGIMTSMFTAIIGTRAVVNLVFGSRRISEIPV